MRRLVAVFAVGFLPVAVLAGADPLVTGVRNAPSTDRKKLENVFKGEGSEVPPCDASGRDPRGGRDCKVVEPLVLPRDGVTDDMLEKYRLKK